VKAQFVLNDKQEPDHFIEMEDGKPIYIYKINLILEAPAAAPTPQRVTFLLDESYYQPVRKADKQGSQFVEEITSYGDFGLTAKPQAGDYIAAKTANLSDLLKKSYGSTSPSAIQEAIQRIEKN
jgi:hypothetical protein